jgi:hypothetical protein
MSWGGHELPKVSLGPAMPQHSGRRPQSGPSQCYMLQSSGTLVFCTNINGFRSFLGLVVPLPPMIYWSKFEQDPLLFAQNKRVPHNCNTVGLIKDDASAPCEQPAAVLMPLCIPHAIRPENHNDNQ